MCRNLNEFQMGLRPIDGLGSPSYILRTAHGVCLLLCRALHSLVLRATIRKNVCTPRKFSFPSPKRQRGGPTTNLGSQRTRGGSVQGFKVSALLGR